MNKKNFLNDKFLKIFLPIMPILLLTGPFLPDLAIVLTSIFFIIFFKNEFIQIIKSEKIFIFFILFWLSIVLSSLFSDDILFSLKSSFFYGRFIIFSIAIFYLVSLDPLILEKFLKYLKIAIYILCFSSIIELLFGVDIFLNKKPNFRITGTFGDEQIVGSFIVKMLPIFACIQLYLKKKFNFETFFFLTISFSIAILSNERSAVFYLICFFLYFISIYPNLALKKKLGLFFITLFAFLVIIISVEDTRSRIVNLTLSQAGLFLLESQNDSDFDSYKKDAKRFHFQSATHEIHILTAINMFKENPILGVGPKMFRKKCDDPDFYLTSDSCTTHPHNILAQILAETGILGFIFFVISIFYLIKNFLSLIKNNKKHDKYLVASKLCLIFLFSKFLFFLIPSGNFLNNFLAAQMFFPLGIYIFINKKLN